MKAQFLKSQSKTTNLSPGTASQQMNGSKITMNAVEKKIKKELKSHHKSSSPPASPGGIEPPKLHRDMRLICDVFRISEQSRHALRTFDAATLEDFSLMTDEDYADLVVTQARIGHPLPPLQQRKLKVLLAWVQALGKTKNLESIPSLSADEPPPKKAEGFEVKEPKGEKNADGILRASYKTSRSPRNDGGTYIPSDWESRFYADLPRLRKELCQIGRNSNWVTEFLGLRWIFCGYEK